MIFECEENMECKRDSLDFYVTKYVFLKEIWGENNPDTLNTLAMVYELGNRPDKAEEIRKKTGL